MGPWTLRECFKPLDFQPEILSSKPLHGFRVWAKQERNKNQPNRKTNDQPLKNSSLIRMHDIRHGPMRWLGLGACAGHVQRLRVEVPPQYLNSWADQICSGSSTAVHHRLVCGQATKGRNHFFAVAQQALPLAPPEPAGVAWQGARQG